MKRPLLTSALALFISVSASADHSDDGKCLDEIKHWNSLSGAQKNEADAKAKRDEGTNQWAQGNKEACETAYTEAIILATD